MLCLSGGPEEAALEFGNVMASLGCVLHDVARICRIVWHGVPPSSMEKVSGPCRDPIVLSGPDVFSFPLLPFHPGANSRTNSGREVGGHRPECTELDFPAHVLGDLPRFVIPPRTHL